jgi:hypothetical protein
MAESTLSLKYDDFAARVGRFLGYGYSSTNWTADQAIEISDLVNSGYRQFLFPPIMPGLTPHEWSFLRGTGTIVTVSGTYQYDFPDNFDGAEGTFSFGTSDGMHGPIRIVGEGDIRRLREGQNNSAGVPRFAAVTPKTVSAGSTGQRFQVSFWPTPNSVWTLTYKYQSHVSILSAASPYPLGGMAHGETILASCLHRAALEGNDDPAAYMSKFIERMNVSIAHDRQRFDREFFGNQNRTMMDGMEPVPTGVLYNGVLP